MHQDVRVAQVPVADSPGAFIDPVGAARWSDAAAMREAGRRVAAEDRETLQMLAEHERSEAKK
jgi:hypothetical protein